MRSEQAVHGIRFVCKAGEEFLTGKERREAILNMLKKSDRQISGGALARQFSRIEDVFVYHRVYGIIRAPMHIRSRLDVKRYQTEISGGKSSPLSNITAGYHYHTVTADSAETLDIIQKELAAHGFLAQLQDYEPVDFWSDQKEKEKHE